MNKINKKITILKDKTTLSSKNNKIIRTHTKIRYCEKKKRLSIRNIELLISFPRGIRFKHYNFDIHNHQ